MDGGSEFLFLASDGIWWDCALLVPPYFLVPAATDEAAFDVETEGGEVGGERFRFEAERGAGFSTQAAEIAALAGRSLQIGEETPDLLRQDRATAEVDRFSSFVLVKDKPVVGAEAALAIRAPSLFHETAGGQKFLAGKELRPDAGETRFDFLGVVFHFFHFFASERVPSSDRTLFFSRSRTEHGNEIKRESFFGGHFSSFSLLGTAYCSKADRRRTKLE